jgi:hypothetical protein
MASPMHQTEFHEADRWPDRHPRPTRRARGTMNFYLGGHNAENGIAKDNPLP